MAEAGRINFYPHPRRQPLPIFFSSCCRTERRSVGCTSIRGRRMLPLGTQKPVAVRVMWPSKSPLMIVSAFLLIAAAGCTPQREIEAARTRGAAAGREDGRNAGEADGYAAAARSRERRSLPGHDQSTLLIREVPQNPYQQRGRRVRIFLSRVRSAMGHVLRPAPCRVPAGRRWDRPLAGIGWRRVGCTPSSQFREA